MTTAVIDRRGHCGECPPCLESHDGHGPHHARIIRAEFSHPANAEGGWYVEVQGTYDEVMGDAGRDLAEASARAHGWDGDRASAGWPTARNLREYQRSFSFPGKGTWAWHQDCWCRHSFCGHRFEWSRPHPRCKAPAPYTRED